MSRERKHGVFEQEIEDEISRYQQQISDQKDANEKSEKLFQNQLQEQETFANKRYNDLLAEMQMTIEKLKADNEEKYKKLSDEADELKVSLLFCHFTNIREYHANWSS